MGKKIKSEKKSTKKKIEIKKKKTRSAGKINKEKKEKIILDNDDSIKDLILNLDAVNQIVLPEESLNIKFESKMNNKNFYSNFKKGINYAKQNFAKYILCILKSLLLVLLGNKNINDDDVFELNSCINDLYRSYKIDFILSLINNEKKLKAIGKNKKDLENNFKNSSDYKILGNPNIFKDAVLFNANYNGNCSFHNFQQLLYSPTIINAYERALFELYGIKSDPKGIKAKLKSFISNHNIYFIHLPNEYYGLTLYDGTILLNSSFSLFNSSIDSLIIFFTLMHELMHALSRIFRGNDNYLIDTREFVKQMKVDDSGSYFENLLLLNCLKDGKLTILEANYLLDSNNYNYLYVDDFKKAFNNFRKKNIKAIGNNIKFSIAKENQEGNFHGAGNHCYCAGSRISNK